MQWSSILLLLVTYACTFLPLSAALSTPDFNCHSLDRLSKTTQRVNPLLERLIQLNGDRAFVPSASSAPEVGSGSVAKGHSGMSVRRRDVEVNEKITSVQNMLGLLSDKIAAKKAGCGEGIMPRSFESIRRRGGWNETGVEDSDSDSASDSDSDSDSDDEEDDGVCELNDVLEKLVDTLECLVSFLAGLLVPVLDLVIDVLNSLIGLLTSLLDKA